MTKTEWQELEEILSGILRQYIMDYRDYDKGSNQKIRKAGKYNVDNAITLANNHIRENLEANKLFFQGIQDGMARRDVADELLHAGKFEQALKDFLVKVKVKIEEFEEGNDY